MAIASLADLVYFSDGLSAGMLCLSTQPWQAHHGQLP